MSVRPLIAAGAGLALALLAGCGAGVLPQIHSEQEHVPVARRLYAKGDYSVAIEVLKAYTTAGGRADTDEALYLLGLCYLKTKEWASAEGEFGRVLRDYPESDSARSASFRLGEAYFGQARGADFDQEYTLKALSQFQEYARTDPDHWLQPEAKRRVAECRTRLATKLARTGDLYVKLKFWEPARLYYQDVVRDYEDTAPYGDALIGLAVVDAHLGRKDEALRRLGEIASQFAGTPFAVRAAKARAVVQKLPAAGDAGPRRHRPVEAPPTPAGSAAPPGTVP